MVAFTFVGLGAVLGNSLFYSTYDASVISMNMEDYRSAMIMMFIYVFTSENYGDVVYGANSSEGLRVYYVMYTFVGMLLLVALIIGALQNRYRKTLAKLHQNEETDTRIAMVIAFVVLHEAQMHAGIEGQTARRLSEAGMVYFREGDLVQVAKQGSHILGAVGKVLDPHWNGFVKLEITSESEEEGEIKTYKAKDLVRWSPPEGEGGGGGGGGGGDGDGATVSANGGHNAASPSAGGAGPHAPMLFKSGSNEYLDGDTPREKRFSLADVHAEYIQERVGNPEEGGGGSSNEFAAMAMKAKAVVQLHKDLQLDWDFFLQ